MKTIRIILAVVLAGAASGCAHWTGYDLRANAGLQQNEGNMDTKATAYYGLSAQYTLIETDNV